MTKKHLIVTVPIMALLIAGASYAVFASRNDATDSTAVSVTPVQQTTKTTESATEKVTESSVEKTATAGVYVDYSTDVFAATKGKRVLFFHASWCPQCRALDASITAGTIPNDVTIFKVDYDSIQKLRQQYGVTLQTTLVSVDESGNEVKKYVAYESPSLAAVIENLL